MIREAGGFITDFAGRDKIIGGNEVVAGNEAVHGDLLKILKKQPLR